MRATGIVRRIDGLGRVVVPKEIRRTLRIKEGDPLEIFTEGKDTVCFKKYSPLGDFKENGITIAKELQDKIGIDLKVVLCDTDTILWTKGYAKLIDTSIPETIEKLMLERANKISGSKLCILNSYLVDFETIICEGDVIGAIMYIADDASIVSSREEKAVLNFASRLIAKSVE